MIALLLAQTLVISGATVYPVSRPKLERATVIIKDGRITAVGTHVAAPANATRIDATGMWVTPGFIDGAGQLGLTEIGNVSGTNDAGVKSDTVAAAFNVLEAINPASTLIPITRMAGVLTTLATPETGLIRGQAVLIDLDGTTVEAMLVRSPAAMVVEISEQTKDLSGGSRASSAARLRQILDDAQEFRTRRADWSRAQLHPLAASAADLTALAPVLRAELPLVVIANRRSDLETALRIAQTYRLKLVLASAAEGWQIADRIARARVPVLIQPLDNIPSYDELSPRLDNAALLAKAGVRVALLEPDTHNARNLRQQAGNAVANGMPWDGALRAVTLTPAEIFGVANRYGSLDSGKVANVVVWSGDPFEFSTRVTHVFIRGKEIPLTSRQTELLERYRKLPPEY
ncbi:MAG TPA: amidohydrolase family protein [Gemmatimonadales bacterium]|nr:amidohydrolase family protein [Gemmatimonadales bacterium]